MPKRPDHTDRWLAAALFAAGFAVVFRGWLFSGFDGAFGDEEDGYLALALIEHWRHVFSGAVPWADLLIFFRRGVRSAIRTGSSWSASLTRRCASSASILSQPT